MVTTRALHRFVAGMHRRIMLAIGKAALKRVDDGAPLQMLQLQLLAGELRDGVPRFQDYGVFSVPLPGAAAVLLAVGGNRDHPVAVGVADGRYRPRDGVGGDAGIHTYLDDPAASAEDALHRLTLGLRDGKRTAILRAERLDVRIGPNRLTMDETGVRLETPDFEAVQAGGGE